MNNVDDLVIIEQKLIRVEMMVGYQISKIDLQNLMKNRHQH
jgi:hypothetical protein